MKKFFVICMVALGIIAAPQNVEAQGFLKKLTKGLDSVNKGLDKAGDKVSEATGQAVTQENGVFVMNPVSKAMSVEVVKAVGHSISENFGHLVGPAQRRIRVDILDRTNYDDPQHRTVWYKSIGELERLRDALDDFTKLAKED